MGTGRARCWVGGDRGVGTPQHTGHVWMPCVERYWVNGYGAQWLPPERGQPGQLPAPLSAGSCRCSGLCCEGRRLADLHRE